MPKNDISQIREATAPDMKCRECGSLMMVCPSGLVCEMGCGRLVASLYSPRVMARAWPERTNKQMGYATKTKHAVLDQDKTLPAANQASFLEE
jgi:hypothetical protein